MVKKVLVCLVACLAVFGGYGCSGGGAEDEALQVETSPELEAAYMKEKQGQELTGKERRILEDARDAGIID